MRSDSRRSVKHELSQTRQAPGAIGLRRHRIDDSVAKAGSRLLRVTLVRAADHARKQDPQLAKVYYQQMVERGAEHIKALCVVAGRLAERGWAVMHRRMPYVVCDTTGEPVTPAQAKAIIAEHWTCRPRYETADAPARAGRGRPLSKSSRDMTGHTHTAWTNEATFPTTIVNGPLDDVKHSPLDISSSIGNQRVDTRHEGSVLGDPAAVLRCCTCRASSSGSRLPHRRRRLGRVTHGTDRD